MIELEKIGIDGKASITIISTLNPIFCFEYEKINQVTKKLAEFSHRSIPVVDKGKNLKGIVTVTDILDAYLRNEDFTQSIEKIIVRKVIVAEDTDEIRFVLQKMKISKRGRLPVVRLKKLIGIVSETDFLMKAKTFDPLSGIKMEDVMIKKPFFIKPENTIYETIRIMVNTKYRRLPIVQDSILVGYITSTKLFSEVVKNNFSKDFLKREISTIMTKNPITVVPKEDLSSAINRMKESGVSSILVSDDKKLVGIFTERDYINLLE
ncbi:MAG: CBS domain-containing protein [Candidatus Aenigmatarchaeota archaeon]